MLNAILFLATALQAVSAQPAEPVLGWNVEPPAPVAGQETELDRLSRSASGGGFDSTIYGSGGDDDRIPVSVTLRALDKVTAQFTDLEIPIGEPASFGTLTLMPRTCSTRPPEEFPETTAFLEVFAGEADVAGRRARSMEADEGTALDPVMPVEDGGEEQPPVQALIDEEMWGEAIFRGWMFASSPSLNAMEHPTYDVWVISCTMVDPEI